MPHTQCPVLGCGRWSHRWTSHGHPQPSAEVFTLQLDERLATPSNDVICHACWKRHADHNLALDGRTRVVPAASSSPLNALLSAVSPLPSSSSTPPSSSSSSSSSPPPTPAVVISSFPTFRLALSTPVPAPATTPLRRAHSSPPILDLSPAPDNYTDRQNTVISNVMAGVDYEKYRMQQVMGGTVPMTKDTWYSHAERVYQAIIEVAEQKEEKDLQRLRTAGQPVVFCADASWSHRKLRYDANQSWWVLMNTDDNQIVLAIVLMKSRWEKGQLVFEGNYEGSSGGMEGASLEKGIARLKAAGLLCQVRGWVVDKDSSVTEQLRANPETAAIPIHYDPGHIKKNFQEQLKDIYGKKVRYEGLSARGGIVHRCHPHDLIPFSTSLISVPMLCFAGVLTLGDWFMVMIKRCEKEVQGSWTEKQQQAKEWLNYFVPHYCNRCQPHDGCPAKHTPVAQRPTRRLRSGEVGKRFLDETHPEDKPKIVALTSLVERMQGDVHLYVHGYHTCCVERANSERTAYTSKRVELYRNWRGKCKLVQLLHNHGATATAGWIRDRLGWEVTEEVREQWRKIDRDKAKHRQIKSDPSYNRRKWELQEERKARSADATAATKKKKRERANQKAVHRYHAKKRLLYEAEERKSDGVGPVMRQEKVAAAGEVVKRKRGRPKKSQAESKERAEKENALSGNGRSPSSTHGETPTAKRMKMDTTTAASTSSDRPALEALASNVIVGVGQLVLHPAMQTLQLVEID